MNTLLKVSLRQKAVFVSNTVHQTALAELRETTSVLVANLAQLGYGVSEPLLKALNQTTPTFQANLLEQFREVMNVNKNWIPLVKGWNVPTGESIVDHIMTFFANVFQAKGTRLQCGHIIPADTFPLERYNGCPFCGTPFETGEIEHYGQGSKLKILSLWTEKDAEKFFANLLKSKTALDATQMDSLKLLLAELPLPKADIAMKETLMAVIDTLVELEHAERAQALFSSPTDIMRYLWYKHTGFLQLVAPKTIAKRKAKNNVNLRPMLDQSAEVGGKAKQALKLKYIRKQCLMVATWLNNLMLPAEKACEMMHPKRGMWVRFIRALRLAEYSKREGFDNLRTLLDVFYNQRYEVWQAKVDRYRLASDAENTLGLLKQRPGLFARSLFANMLWFGKDKVIEAFGEVVDQVPARLVFTLNMYADNYFDSKMQRTVKPLGGISKAVPPNKLLRLYKPKQIRAMQDSIQDLCLLAMKKRFAAIENNHESMYIDPMLFKMPVSIGDRSESVQDLPSALMGTRFALEGNTVRLFMQWGEGLPAQHLDMDLSCYVSYSNKADICSYSRLHTTGCKHSGDIRSIPEKVGTAEYIDINVPELKKAGAKYVTFTCNAYSNGSITPNLVVGWMDSKKPMKISAKTGVAYDPSCVQHQVRVTSSVTKGLVFGVLDIAANEIVWLEMPFAGQVVQNMNEDAVKGILAKLDAKLSVGNLLKVKAEAQGLVMVETAEADEAYTSEWAMDVAAVTQLLVD
ncbi:hypothetical protein [Microscilla marina]|uniref:Prokaryotic RING finger family 4 n=1 Tax=Microscilla marina ATCC 23134 TaxID=313606 RepID=A1ZEU9_MICM2|nr:hypothetical protein [Microscilla marina]EAY31051.1 hypothetical protein M23134_07459 [Microscilla marina ATCC 23134]